MSARDRVPRPLHAVLGIAATLLAPLIAATSAAAQASIDDLRPHLTWRTVETRHFVVHYPREIEAWTLDIAARLDSIHTAVAALVGNAPPRRVTVVVADPVNVTGGFAFPLLRAPTILLWPTPPEPRTLVGEHRGYAELLAVHEYGHIAHLAWPSRNPGERRLWSLLPIQLGPIPRRSPRWVTEGYATYIEGRLTGRGRPYGATRATILRQWALEGRLPTYAQLSATGEFQGLAMAYLAGSAFFEWLVEQRGEPSLNHLWRRLTAVQRRGFADAFAGVYGGRPDELYGRFTVELTREALEAERLLQAGGIVEGEPYQRLSWFTGEPAVSRDGERIALVLRARGEPSRLVVWRTEEPVDTLEERRRELLLERDPLDVPAIEWRPRPKRPIAELHPVAGRGHDAPRFLPDGRILVTRAEPLPDGALRTDLFIWDVERQALRRITRGAAIRHPDPSPDGRHAVGARCVEGLCQLVRVDLEGGAVDVLHLGELGVVFHRPRYAPDSREVAVAMQIGGRWRIALTDDAGAPLRYVDPPDGADRYDPAWLPHGDALVVVSHRGGVPNLERIDLPTGEARRLTQTTSAHFAPEPNPVDGSLFFLRLHSRGLDLHRLERGAAEPARAVDLEAQLARVAPPAPLIADTFPRQALAEPRGYGAGPRTLRLLPSAGTSADGAFAALSLTRTDPVGRLGWTATGAAGGPGTWRGFGAGAAWRGTRPSVHADLWAARQRPSARWEPALIAEPLDVEYAGAALWTQGARHGTRSRRSARVGAAAGRLDPRESDSERISRNLAFAELRLDGVFGARPRLEPSLQLHGSVGATGAGRWERGIATARLALVGRAAGIAAELSRGSIGGDVHRFEEFVLGGAPPALFEPGLLPQRVEMPAVPLGLLPGREFTTFRLSTGGPGLSPYFWAGRTGGTFEGWYRVIGIEQQGEIGPLSLLRLPALRLVSGIGYPLDQPFRHRLRGYFSLVFRP